MFITIGPYQATGSLIGLPETRRNRITSYNVCYTKLLRAWKHGPATLETRHRRKDGTTFPVEIKIGTIRVNEEEVVLTLARDISYNFV